MKQPFELRWPSGGRSDSNPKGEQSIDTTVDALNVESVDSRTGRNRGASRSGHSKVVSAQVTGSNAVRQIALTEFDNPSVTFAQYAQGSQVTDWQKVVPLKDSVRAVAIDLQRNRYAIMGRATLVKYNASGDLVWKFAIPVASQEHIIRALVVDDLGSFYVGVSEGKPQTTSKLMKLRGAEDGSGVPSVEWSLTIAGYVEQLRLREGVLYAACNFTDTWQSSIRAYRQIDTAVPELMWERTQVPYPVNGMAVRRIDGAIFTAHPANTTRAYWRTSTNTQKVAEDWVESNMTDYEQRIHCIIDPEDVDGLDNSETANGDSLVQIVDASDQNRNLDTSPSGDASTDPVLQTNVVAGRSVIAFPGTAALVGKLPTSTTAGTAPIQRGLLPTHDDAWWACFIVGRTEPGTTVFPLLSYTQAGNQDIIVALNASAIANGAPTYGTTASSGSVKLRNGTGTNPATGTYDTTNGFFIIGIVAKTDGTASGSYISVNGRNSPSTFTMVNSQTTSPVQFGSAWNGYTTGTELLSGVTQSPFVGEIYKVVTFHDYTPSGGSKTIMSTAEFQNMEGRLAWQFGLAHLLESSHPYFSQPPTNDPLPGTSDSAYKYLTDSGAMLVKWDPNKARPRWVVQDNSATGFGGLGYAVEVPDNGSTDYLFSFGAKGDGTGGTTAQILSREAVVRRIKDNGDSATTTGSGTWEARWGSAGSALEPSYQYPRCAVGGKSANDRDDDGTALSYFYVPYHPSSGSSALYVYLDSGSAAGAGSDTAEHRTIDLSGGQRAYCVAVEPFRPEYSPGLLSSLIDQSVTIGSVKEGTDDYTLTTVTLVSETRADVSPRSTYVLASAGTSLKRVSESAVAAPTAAAAMNGLNYVSIASEFGKFWISDGTTYQVLDPRAGNGVARLWRSKTAGDLPEGCRIVVPWRKRMLMARGEDPSAVFGTAIGEPENADLFPVNPNGSEAVLFDTGGTVNTIIPYSDDLLIIGTQTQTLRMTGDPAKGGDLDSISSSEGLAFGEPWCKDPEGRVYAFTAKGGVTVFSLGSPPQSITDQAKKSVRRMLEAVDLSLYYVRLVWNWRQGGLNVYLIPQGSGGTTTQSFFWHRATNSWWERQLGFVVTSAREVNGDTISRRAIWLGCADGYVRKEDETVDTDDGTKIYWRVVGGPIHDPKQQTVLSGPVFDLASEQNGAKCVLFSSDKPDLPSQPDTNEATLQGRGERLPIRTRGGYVWWKLYGTGAMAYEGGSAEVEPGGMRRRMS